MKLVSNKFQNDVINPGLNVSVKNIQSYSANHGIDKGGVVVEHTVKNVADSQLGSMIGLALLLFVFFKYGVDALITVMK